MVCLCDEMSNLIGHYLFIHVVKSLHYTIKGITTAKLMFLQDNHSVNMWITKDNKE